MCLAIPGKIVAKEGNKVVVDYGDHKVEAGILTGEFKVGEHVIVQGQIVVDKIPDEQVEKWNEFLKSSK